MHAYAVYPRVNVENWQISLSEKNAFLETPRQGLPKSGQPYVHCPSPASLANASRAESSPPLKLTHVRTLDLASQSTQPPVPEAIATALRPDYLRRCPALRALCGPLRELSSRSSRYT
jgi:hypothetical protein